MTAELERRDATERSDQVQPSEGTASEQRNGVVQSRGGKMAPGKKVDGKPAADETATKKPALGKKAPRKVSEARASSTGLEPGDKAPPFTLRDGEGRSVSLADFAGRQVILYFYPADDTPGCTKEACGFRDAWDDIRELGAVVLGVSPDGAEAHRRFAAKYRLPFPLLSDPDHAVLTAYGAYGEKSLYGKKVVGVIRSTVWIGGDGRIRRRWPRVADAAEHPAHVLAALRDAWSR